MERVTDSAIGSRNYHSQNAVRLLGSAEAGNAAGPSPPLAPIGGALTFPGSRARAGRFCGSRRRLVQPPPGAGSWRPRANRRDSVPIPEFSHGVQTGKSSGERWAEGGETMAEGGQRCRREGGIRRHCKVD